MVKTKKTLYPKNRSERFPHKPYINEGFPKNATVVINGNVTFRCPIVSDLEPFIQWLKIANYSGNQEEKPNGTLLQVQYQQNKKKNK